VHVLDCTSEHVLEEYDAIRNELFLFDEEVGDKPELVALNKVNAKPGKLNPKPLTLNP
jgi:GTP-binding protein